MTKGTECSANWKAFNEMRKNQLNNLLYFFLLFIFLSAGCAHKQINQSTAPSTDSLIQQNGQPAIAEKDQAPSSADATGEVENDFFEDEFEEEAVLVSDPFSHWNRAMFHFNDKLYFWVLKPLARGYKAITPDFFRVGVKNFFRNITTPVRLVNCLLQGKGDAAVNEFARFVINTTVGVLGLGSPADNIPEVAPPSEEDLGQTLARYGIGNGFYIVWPVLGPSTLRDTFGMVGDFFLKPVSYVDSTEASIAIWSFDKVNETSFRIGDYESLKKAAIDPYLAIRNVYIQYRNTQLEE